MSSTLCRLGIPSAANEKNSPAYLVEIFPYAQRARGISIFQFFGKAAQFFGTNVNPIGLGDIGWKFLLVYCCWIVVEALMIYFLWPETSSRSLEELAFCKQPPSCLPWTLDPLSVFASSNPPKCSRRIRATSRLTLSRTSCTTIARPRTRR